MDFDPALHYKFENIRDGLLYVIVFAEYPDFWNDWNQAAPEKRYVFHMINRHDIIIHHADEPTRRLYMFPKSEMEQRGQLYRLPNR